MGNLPQTCPRLLQLRTQSSAGPSPRCKSGSSRGGTIRIRLLTVQREHNKITCRVRDKTDTRATRQCCTQCATRTTEVTHRILSAHAVTSSASAVRGAPTVTAPPQSAPSRLFCTREKLLQVRRRPHSLATVCPQAFSPARDKTRVVQGEVIKVVKPEDSKDARKVGNKKSARKVKSNKHSHRTHLNLSTYSPVGT